MLLVAAQRRQIDVVACVKLDRLARSLHHLVTLAKEFEALGVDLVVLDQAIDTTTPSGRLMFHILGAVAEFERSLIVERVKAGMRRAKAQGIRLGRPRVHELDPDEVATLKAEGLSLGEIGRRLGNGHPVHPTIVRRHLPGRRRGQGPKPSAPEHR